MRRQRLVVEQARRHGGDQRIGVVETRVERQARDESPNESSGAISISIRKRSRAAPGSSNVSSFSTRLRSANTCRCGNRYSVLNARQAALGHRAQQQRMHLRPRAIDLVEEEYRQRRAVRQQRTRIDARLAVAVDEGVIDEILRHQVDRAFDALVGAAEAARRRAQQRRLADADVAFEQHVAAREDRDDQQADRARQAEHATVQRALEFERPRAPLVKFAVESVHRTRHRLSAASVVAAPSCPQGEVARWASRRASVFQISWQRCAGFAGQRRRRHLACRARSEGQRFFFFARTYSTRLCSSIT